MAPMYLFLGAMFASIDLSTVDFAQRHGHKPLAGFILGTYALGQRHRRPVVRLADLAVRRWSAGSR